MTEPVLVREPRGAVLVLRLNRPEARNALSFELISELGLGLEAAETDPGTRCVVLTGTGDRAFCAGMDLRAFAAGESMSEDQQRGMAVFGRFMRGDVEVPVVGAANATAVAGGFELLLGCDVVVASDQASFGLPEVKRGLFAAGGGVFVSTRIPLALALELTLTGDYIDAARAHALGLVNQVVPPEQVSTRPSRWPNASRATARWPSRPPRSWSDWRPPTARRHGSCTPSGSPRCSTARTPRRAPPPSSRSATPCGTGADYLISGSRGRPRMRSPIWLRLISDVPPAIDMARCISTSVPVIAAGAVEERGVGAGQLGQDGGRLVADLGQDELGDVALRARRAAGHRPVSAAQVEHGHGLVSAPCSDRCGPRRRPGARGGRRTGR